MVYFLFLPQTRTFLQLIYFFNQVHICGHTEGHPVVPGVHDRRPRAAGQRLHPHHRLEQLHLQAGVQVDTQHAAAGHRGAAGEMLGVTCGVVL